MVNSAAVALAQGLIHLSVILLYLAASLFAYWRLIPRLSRAAKYLATIALAVQVILIVLSRVTQNSSGFTHWLWRLDTEWNVPSTLASTQLALVGGAALLTAWIAANRASGLRLYLAGVGLVVLFLGYDEYSRIHETIWNWPMYYAAVGAAIALATLAVAIRFPPRTRLWYLCLVIGLAIAATGAVMFEEDFWECGIGIYSRFGICIERVHPAYAFLYVLEESIEFLGIWLALVAVLGILSDVWPAPAPRIRWVFYALPLFWIAFLVQSDVILPIEQQSTAEGAAVAFDSGARLHGYRINRSKGALHLHLYLSPNMWNFGGLGYSIHLVDQVSLTSIAGRNKFTNTELEFWIGPGYVPVHRQWMQVDIPADTPRNRALWVILALWRKEGEDFIGQKVLSSDLQLLSDTQVILSELVLHAPVRPQSTVPLVVFDNGFALQAVDMPEYVLAGTVLELAFTWRADAPGREDFVQFVHLGHKETGEWLVFDRQPLGARLPTRLWYNGLSDSEIWQVPLPDDLAAGSYTVFSGLYGVRDRERVKAYDADGSSYLDSLVPLGNVMVQ